MTTTTLMMLQQHHDNNYNMTADSFDTALAYHKRMKTFTLVFNLVFTVIGILGNAMTICVVITKKLAPSSPNASIINRQPLAAAAAIQQHQQHSNKYKYRYQALMRQQQDNNSLATNNTNSPPISPQQAQNTTTTTSTSTPTPVRLKPNLSFSAQSRSTQKSSSTATSASHAFTSADVYLISLATADICFLFLNSVQNILPRMDLVNLFNSSVLFCKIVSFLRNSSRMCSSYVVVCFSWERFYHICMPFKSLKYSTTRCTAKIVLTVVMCALALTACTPLLTTLEHEYDVILDENYTAINVTKQHCVVEPIYRRFYAIYAFFYGCIEIVWPMLLISYFNISICSVLLTRKRQFHHFFKQQQQKEQQRQTTATTASSSSSPKQKRPKKIPPRLTLLNEQSSVANLSIAAQNSPPLQQTDGIYLQVTSNANINSDAISADLSMLASSCDMLEDTGCATTTDSPLSIIVPTPLPVKTTTPASNKVSPPRRAKPQRSHPHHSSHHAAKINAMSIQATKILLLISFFFVTLNLPYFGVYTYKNFINAFFFQDDAAVDVVEEHGGDVEEEDMAFVAQQIKDFNLLNNVFVVEAFSNLCEILHIINFGLCFFLYCMSSRIFRQELKAKLLWWRKWK